MPTQRAGEEAFLATNSTMLLRPTEEIPVCIRAFFMINWATVLQRSFNAINRNTFNVRWFVFMSMSASLFF